uniref:Glyco_trans_2-like domain-containing protein n=1 Tax=Strongyloides stercoralis TaxID=6248 RepID=A0A0K0ENY5_STRER
MVNEEFSLSNYAQAIKTIWCYSLQYNYTFVILNEYRNPELSINCNHKDFMFRRHCLISNFGQKNEDKIKYIVFIDGDIGVVNPLHRLEEYLPKNEEEILFYDRIFNYEIMAGSYIIRNNLYSRNFINYFADYEYKMPKISSGRDNVALQAVFLDLVGPTNYVEKYKQCLNIYNNATTFEQNMIFVSCMRYILSLLDETPNSTDYYTYKKGKIKVLRKLSLRRWSRDTWLTDWLFCENDFMLHGWKTNEIASHNKIFSTEFNPTESLCKSSNFPEAWNYNLSAKVSCKKVNKSIMDWVKGAYTNHLNDLNSRKDNLLPHQIAIVMVNEEFSLSNYAQAIKTIWCYSLQYNYTFVILNEKRSPELGINCNQTDFMFRRHCLISNFGQKNKDKIKYIVFIDGDIGVVNPLHRLEEYLPKNEEEIIFCDRIFNYEIMAGSYIIRNNLYTRNFINYFADYEYKMPKINNGRDNVALQAVFLDLVGSTNYVEKYKQCLNIYNNATTFKQNMIFVSCMRYILSLLDETPDSTDYQTYDKGKIKILRKLSSKRWSRDTWLTNWLFCENDFMLHGWKANEIASHLKIFSTEFNPTESFCKSSNFSEAWDYNLSAKVSCKKVNKSIMNWVKGAYTNHLNDLNSSKVLLVK